jgi:molecular chaperone GrpE
MRDKKFDDEKQKPKQAASAHAESLEDDSLQDSPAQQEADEVEEVVEKKHSKSKKASKEAIITELEDELDQARQQAAEYFEGWQRERADFSNFRKRIDREQAQLRANVTGSIIQKYLVVLDDIELALKTRPKDGEGAAWADGIELISRKLKSILEAEGVETITEGDGTFDPLIHEAITSEESPDHENGQIIEVFQKGYKLKDWVIRPARVRVAR